MARRHGRRGGSDEHAAGRYRRPWAADRGPAGRASDGWSSPASRPRVLEGGDGPPVVLLHGPGANAAHWLRVLPDLVRRHRVVAPDLPGHGASEPADGRSTPTRVLAWLGELIERTCASPPVAGRATRSAARSRPASPPTRRPDQPARARRRARSGRRSTRRRSSARRCRSSSPSPRERTHDLLWQHCALDLDGLRERMGERWAPFARLQRRPRPHAERAGRARRADGASSACRRSRPAELDADRGPHHA